MKFLKIKIITFIVLLKCLAVLRYSCICVRDIRVLKEQLHVLPSWHRSNCYFKSSNQYRTASWAWVERAFSSACSMSKLSGRTGSG